MIKIMIVKMFLKKINKWINYKRKNKWNGGEEEKMNMNVLFMRICKRIEFGMNLNLIHETQWGINM